MMEKEKTNVTMVFLSKYFFFIFHFQILYFALFSFVHYLLHNKSKKMTIAMK